MIYIINGSDWIKIENSLEISGFHHNTFGGFLGVRIGLCSVGEGSVKFKNFKYTPITNQNKLRKDIFKSLIKKIDCKVFIIKIETK